MEARARKAEREGSRHLDRHHEHAACAKASEHQPQSSVGVCGLFVLFCKRAAGSGVSLHHQYSIKSFHPDEARNSPFPLIFFQPLADCKRWQQRPFHLISLRKNKACRLQEGENLATKVPAAYLLGARLICIISKALTPLSFAFSLLLLESFIFASFVMNHQDLKLQTKQTSEHLGLARDQQGMQVRGISS